MSTRRARLFLAGASLLVATGCGVLGPPLPIEPVAGEPWQIGTDAYPTQRLFRVRYEDARDRAGFKLSLYLAGADHYRMQAADSLGRKLWSLAVEPSGQALWLDHRQREYCRAASSRDLRLVPIARLPLSALPRLLLGRLPAVPASDLYRDAERLQFLDPAGRTWAARLRPGGLEWWTLAEAGETIAWWQREDEGSLFVDPRHGRQVRWQETVREPLAVALEPLDVPAGWSEGACAEALGEGTVLGSS